MTKFHLLVLCTLAICPLAGCKSEPAKTTPANENRNASQATPDQWATARTFFTKDCQSCHGAKGEGGPVKLDDGTRLKVPSLREGHALRHPDSDFVKQITRGGDGMPAFEKKLTPEQINDMVKFVRHEFQGK